MSKKNRMICYNHKCEKPKRISIQGLEAPMVFRHQMQLDSRCILVMVSSLCIGIFLWNGKGRNGERIYNFISEDDRVGMVR